MRDLVTRIVRLETRMRSGALLTIPLFEGETDEQALMRTRPCGAPPYELAVYIRKFMPRPPSR